MWTFETPPLSHKLRKGYVCFKSGGKAGRGGSLLIFAEKTDALKVGRYPDLHPAATTGFLCSLAHITKVDTWNDHSQFSKELWQLQMDSGASLSPYPWQPPLRYSLPYP